MTIPIERKRSFFALRDFARDLLDPKKTPKVPGYIRSRAHSCLRHYPWDHQMRQIVEIFPEMFGQDDEEITFVPRSKPIQVRSKKLKSSNKKQRT